MVIGLWCIWWSYDLSGRNLSLTKSGLQTNTQRSQKLINGWDSQYHSLEPTASGNWLTEPSSPFAYRKGTQTVFISPKSGIEWITRKNRLGQHHTCTNSANLPVMFLPACVPKDSSVVPQVSCALLCLKPGAHPLGSACWPGSGMHSPISISLALALQVWVINTLFFYLGSGDSAKVFLIAQQVNRLCYLPEHNQTSFPQWELFPHD